jgi:hypothetical protein
MVHDGGGGGGGGGGICKGSIMSELITAKSFFSFSGDAFGFLFWWCGLDAQVHSFDLDPVPRPSKFCVLLDPRVNSSFWYIGAGMAANGRAAASSRCR